MQEQRKRCGVVGIGNRARSWISGIVERHPAAAQLLMALATVCATALTCTAAPKPENLTADDQLWRAKIGFNPQVHASVENSSDAEVFARVPYAYYPSTNELEVAFDAAAAVKLLPVGSPKPAGTPDSVRIRVYPAVIAPEALASMPFSFAPTPSPRPAPDNELASDTIPLDALGRGHGVLKLPRLPSGNYRVEYEFGGVRLTVSRTFRRTGFEWEGCSFGTEHKVYAPFTPIVVDGPRVSVVDRTYTVNRLGLFDSVMAKGRELLAAPMTLEIELADGRRVQWRDGGGRFGRSVKGQALYPDLATFDCEARSEISNLKSQILIEEDGSAKITMTLAPSSALHGSPVTIARAWLEIALKESEAPLCHLVGMNSMRHNYAGTVPRGGEITWIMQPWRPARFEVTPFAGQVPASYQVWEANQQMHWGSQRWNFAPYIWLGAEERGLAWFGDYPHGCTTDGKRSLQRLFIEPGRVVLRVELIQQPTTLTAPRTFEFGLQASPTKPMRPDWRGHEVPGGGGMSVVVWGGFNCADKVPANKDWSLVDKIMEGRITGKADYPWFAEYAKTHQTVTGSGGAKAGDLRVIPLTEATANGQPWLTAVNHFAGLLAGRPAGVSVYYEEHQTSGNYPEVAEFMDEWSDGTFARYRYFDYPRTWGPEIRSANPASYRDFAVFYANEWMKRGVGIYYDNTYPQIDGNRAHFRAGGGDWSSSIWGHREYYKRVWKRSRELMLTGATPLPLHTIGHVTNCQVLPFTTWWDATLGVEQPGQWLPDTPLTPEQRRQQLAEWGFLILPTPSKNTTGQALPYPPDYLRAMECGRMAGLIPHYRHLLRSEDAVGGLGISFGATDQGTDAAVREHRLFSDAAMGLVHEIRGGANGYDHPLVGSLRRAIAEFGYGKPDVQVHNYWEEKPVVRIGNPQVKWLAMRAAMEGERSTVNIQRPTSNEDTSPVPAQALLPAPGAQLNLAPRPLNPSPMGLLLLQSYSPEAATTTVSFPDGKLLVDAQSRETFAADAAGTVTLSLSADYGTRLLYVLRSPQEPKLLPVVPGTVLGEDFELGLGFNLGIRGSTFEVAADATTPGNHLLRITPGHPAQNVLRPQNVTIPANGDLSFRFRLPELPTTAGAGGLLHLGYHERDGQRYAFGLSLSRTQDGPARWTVAKPLLSLDGGKNEGYQSVLAATPSTAAADTAWHTLTIRTQGKRQQIRLDGQLLFEGEDDRLPDGGFSIAPGWGWELPIPYIELDDLRVSNTAPVAADK